MVYQIIRSGTYDGTPTDLVNLDSVVADDLNYSRVVNTNTVFGLITIDSTGVGNCSFQLDIPVPSTLTESIVGGAGAAIGMPTPISVSIKQKSETTVQFDFAVLGNTSFVISFSFSYTIL